MTYSSALKKKKIVHRHIQCLDDSVHNYPVISKTLLLPFSGPLKCVITFLHNFICLTDTHMQIHTHAFLPKQVVIRASP